MKQLKLDFNLDAGVERLAKELIKKQRICTGGTVLFPFSALVNKIKRYGMEGWHVQSDSGRQYGFILFEGKDVSGMGEWP